MSGGKVVALSDYRDDGMSSRLKRLRAAPRADWIVCSLVALELEIGRALTRTELERAVSALDDLRAEVGS